METLSNKALVKVLVNEDELGVVIRTGIYVDSLINEFISKNLQKAKEIESLNFGFFVKVHLALALGLNKRFKRPLLVLGSIRNKFAHEIKTSIDNKMTQKLYSSLDEREVFVLEEKFKVIINKRKPEERREWLEMSPRTQFQTMAIVIYQGLLGAVEGSE